MQKLRKSKDDTSYVLNFLFKKREELLLPFLNKDYKWIGLSFKYERNPAAFNLVREYYKTLWIDTHLLDILSNPKFDIVKLKILYNLLELIENKTFKLQNTQIAHTLLTSKLEVIGELLKHGDNKRFNELKFSYEKDKALFEREFSKYSADINE
jgi:hypothetical protein